MIVYLTRDPLELVVDLDQSTALSKVSMGFSAVAVILTQDSLVPVPTAIEAQLVILVVLILQDASQICDQLLMVYPEARRTAPL